MWRPAALGGGAGRFKQPAPRRRRAQNGDRRINGTWNKRCLRQARSPFHLYTLDGARPALSLRVGSRRLDGSVAGSPRRKGAYVGGSFTDRDDRAASGSRAGSRMPDASNAQRDDSRGSPHKTTQHDGRHQHIAGPVPPIQKHCMHGQHAYGPRCGHAAPALPLLVRNGGVLGGELGGVWWPP